jgi:hypothetical protein
VSSDPSSIELNFFAFVNLIALKSKIKLHVYL